MMKYIALFITLGLLLSVRPSFAADGLEIVARHGAIFNGPPNAVPTQGMPDGPLLGNGDVGVVLAGPPEAQQFYIGKNDFWTHTPGTAKVINVGRISLNIPALQGATYRQEQDMAHAQVRGTFVKDGLTVTIRSWVDAHENLLISVLHCQGDKPVEIALRQNTGEQNSVPPVVADNDNPVNIGREQYNGGRWYFDGNIMDVQIKSNALTGDELHHIMDQKIPGPQAQHFDGKSAFEEVAQPRMAMAVSVAAWIKIESASPEANYIVSKGSWDQAYSLGLTANGCLRWSINGQSVQTAQSLELHKWIHVAGTFDGLKMCAYVNGVVKASMGGDGNSAHCMKWFTRNADALPGSRTVAVVSRIMGPAAVGGLCATLQPGQNLTVVTAVLSDLDAKDNLAAARQRVENLQPADIEKLSAQHQAWWKNFWSKSFIEIPDKEIEKRWYAALYVLGSCSRAGKVAPGLWGNWVTTNDPNWAGDFHLNYNFQAPYYMVYSGNHTDLSLPYYQAIWESVPNGRAMAKRRGWKGIHFPVCIGPWGLSPEDPNQDWGQRSDAVFAGMNFIWQYQYTQDTEFLRKTAYPYLREVADFWEDYLKFENGRYVIYNDSVHEGSGADFNPIFSLGLVRTLFKNMIQMSKDLGVDGDRRAKWQDICDKISAFPTQVINGKTCFRYSEKGLGWFDSNTLGVYHIYPGDAIGLDSDPKLLEISRNMIDAMHRWADYNGFSNWYTVCARVGYDPKMILAKLRETCDSHSFPNLVLNFGGGGIENCSGFVAINEMLLQSHEDVIRFFPCWPKDQDARFGDLRAVGAFLVSAELKNGVITGVKIISEKGKDCAMVNPWPGQTVRIIRNKKTAETASGDRFTLKTQVAETLHLERQSP